MNPQCSERVAREQEEACNFSSVMEFKLAVGAAAVNLNGFFRNAEFCSDFFIGITLCHHADHFAFALRELLETGLEICDFGLIAAVGFIAGDGSFNHINETRFLRGFSRKSKAPFFTAFTAMSMSA